MSAALLLAAALVAADASAAIRVDDVSIPAAAVTARKAELLSRGRDPDDAAFVKGLVDEALLALDAQRSGLAATPAIKGKVVAERTRVLAAVFVDREIVKNATPSEELLRSLYHSNSDFVRLSLVVVETEAAAKEVRRRLDAGGEIELEASRSLDPASAARRGDTGDLARGQLPPGAAEPVFKASVGSLVGPMPWAMGWAVARVDRRTIGDEAGFKAKRTNLEQHARNMVIGQAKEHFLRVIRDREKITIDERFLDGLGTRIDPANDAEAGHVLATVRGVPMRYVDVLPGIRDAKRTIGSMHAPGPAVKKQVVDKLLDDWILAALARERGLDKSPDVQARLAQAERMALAGAAIDRISAGVPRGSPPKAAQKAIDERLASLRAKAAIQIDNAQVAAAIRAAK